MSHFTVRFIAGLNTHRINVKADDAVEAVSIASEGRLVKVSRGAITAVDAWFETPEEFERSR